MLPEDETTGLHAPRIKMGHAPRVDAIEQNSWDLGNAVRETEKQFATDLQLVMTETTNDPSLLKTLV